MPTTKRERQRANRARKRAELQKVERRRRIRRRAIRIAIVAGIAAVALVVASQLSGDSGDSTTTTAAAATTTAPAVASPPEELPQTYQDYRALPAACGAETPPPVREMTFEAPEDQGIPAGAAVTATVVTSCGDIVLELDPEAAPETVNSFVFLARQGYFDGSVFHRILGDFVIQGGDPSATGRGGPGYIVPDEVPTAGFSYTRGTLAMANSGPGSTGSQFFIVTGEEAGLPPAYSVFGRALDSDAPLDAIAAVEVTGRDGTAASEQSLPLEAVYIESVAIDIAE